MNITKTEPVRLVGHTVAVITFISAVVVQVNTSWDSATGWYGLGIAVLIAVATEVQRSKVTPVAQLAETWAPAHAEPAPVTPLIDPDTHAAVLAENAELSNELRKAQRREKAAKTRAARATAIAAKAPKPRKR